MIETERLVLRHWTDADRPVFHAHCSDPEVMRYMGPLMTRGESDAKLDQMAAYDASHGYSFRAVERRADGVLLGFCGLKPGAPGTPIEDKVEIGWRFARFAWGQGYAYEAARASLDWAWAHLDVADVWAITTAANDASRRLMDRLGMIRRDDLAFDHPAVAVGSALRRHVTYVVARDGRALPSR